ncbi:MAG TPA: hypothetical protein VFG10_01000 [Saprospiraceae bacterium]|nr:hypothetical protein [Saprospiraceae bacterium]
MNMNREKTSSVMGFVVSLLLHGIFFAGCIAINFNINDGTATKSETNEITKVASHQDMGKMKS